MKFDLRMKHLGMLLLGLMLLAPAGFAQNNGDRDWRRANGNSNSAVDRGYQDGLRQGQEDRARRANHNFRNRDWQRGDRGYDKSMGARGQYKQGYRDGYERGYEEAFYGRNANNGDYGRNGRTPRNGYPNTGYPNTGYPNGGNNSSYLEQQARQNGQADGVYYGQMDRRNGHSNRPTEVKGYKDADHGYSSQLGSKSDFQRIYRDAFIRGYQQGYGSFGYRR